MPDLRPPGPDPSSRPTLCVVGAGPTGIGVPADEHRATLELFLDRVAPILRAELPSRVWPDTEVTG